MIHTLPKGLFTWSCDLRDGSQLVATLEIPLFGEEGRVTSEGHRWELGRESWHHGKYFLKQGGRILATADKPSLFSRSFDVALGADRYKWAAEAPVVRPFVLRRGDQVVGSMRPVMPLTRDAQVDLPETLPVEQRAFLVWLALLIWRRNRR